MDEIKNVSAYTNTARCCGCTACSAVCPVHAITMSADSEGFFYPRIDETICINCSLCVKVCAFSAEKKDFTGQRAIQAYAAKNKNEITRMNSRSGGVFTAITNQILKEHGYVYGVAINQSFTAEHRRAENKEERDAFCGSKYIQSDMRDTFLKVKKDLLDGNTVAFSGTACQIAGLKSYLRKMDTRKLYLIDIVCHGVPSPRVWMDYLEAYRKKYKGEITEVNFRNKKKYGWAGGKETITVNGKEYDSDEFLMLFNSGVIERPSCFQCPYKTVEREGDITLGDFWGIEKVAEQMNDNKGVSLVFCNTQKGKDLFESVKGEFELKEVRVQDTLQEALVQPMKEPEDRKFFWKRYQKGGIVFAKKYVTWLKIKRRLKKYF